MGRSFFAIGIVPHTLTEKYIYIYIYRKWGLQNNVIKIDKAADVMNFPVM